MIFIVSMHRSGSSLLAGLLEENGFYLGSEEELIGAREDNKKGFKERHDVIQLNESILKQSGSKFSSSIPDVDFDFNSVDISTELKKLKNKFYETNITLIKDPRICLLLPQWLEIFPEAKIIFLHRNPLEVAESLYRRQKMPRTGGLALWEYYTSHALNSLKDTPFYSLNFNKLVKDIDGELEKLKSWIKPNNNQDKTHIDTLNNASSFYDVGLINNNASKLSESGRLTASQRVLHNSIISNNVISTEVKTSESCLATLSLMKELAISNDHIGSSRLVDHLAQKRFKKLSIQLKELTLRNNEVEKKLIAYRNTTNLFIASKTAKVLHLFWLTKARILRKPEDKIITNKMISLLSKTDKSKNHE